MVVHCNPARKNIDQAGSSRLSLRERELEVVVKELKDCHAQERMCQGHKFAVFDAVQVVTELVDKEDVEAVASDSGHLYVLVFHAKWGFAVVTVVAAPLAMQVWLVFVERMARDLGSSFPEHLLLAETENLETGYNGIA